MSSFCPRALRLAALPALALSLPLSLTAQWRPLPANVTPQAPLSGITLTPTSAGDLLLLGAVSAGNDWLWSGTHWTFAPATLQPRRRAQAAAADLGNGDVVAFGGLDANNAALFDTWRFDGQAWQSVPTASAPPALSLMSMAWDPVTETMILTGRNAQNAFQTWRLDSDWSLVAGATFPAGTADVDLYSDTVRGVTGAFVKGAADVAVYELDGGAWVSRASLAGGSGLGVASFDAVRGRAVFFESVLAFPGTVFEFDGLTLTRTAVAAPPTLSAGMAMAFLEDRGETVLVTAGSQVQAWGWSPASVPFATPYGVPCADPAFRLAIAPGDVPTIGAGHRLAAQAASGSFAFVALGLSHTFDNGFLPRLIPNTLCEQRVQLLGSTLLLSSPATFLFQVPNAPALLGVRYDAQMISGDATGIVDSTNGLEVQIGLPLLESSLTETFVTDFARDPATSGDVWANGVVTPTALGGDGRHGSFDPALGTMVAPDEFVWDTTSITIPPANSLNGQTYVVTDGRFFFTDMTVPAGTTIRFVGPVPPVFRVRGEVDIAGTLDLDGAPMTTFNARGATTSTQPFVIGQPGGEPGAGGGFGGRGADECQGTGPIIVAGEVRTNGADGEDVRVMAGHAYTANVAGTGGKGSSMNPPAGNAAPNSPLVGFVYRAYFASGGGGGGFNGPGGTASVTPLTNLQVGPVPAGGVAFNLFPVASASSLEHFTVGGSGGGGGATHAFGTIYVSGDVYIAGSAGSGGGGACAVRSGGAMDVAATAQLEARGGAGALINGRDPNGFPNNVNWGVSCPGGGGSGGSFLLQTSSAMNVAGTIDTSGGDGSSTSNISTASINVQSQAGAGAVGFYRLESALGTSFTGQGVPAYNAATNAGALTDTDDHTGSRSVWLVPAAAALPYYLRYELVVDVNGQTVLFSDDPAISTVAADDPSGAVYLRFQGAQVDPMTGAALPSTAGPWRTHVVPGPGTLNSDRAEAVRFDIVLDKGAGTLQVRELRVIWR